MPFFLRKSISKGPVRINFSKGGIGLSAGVTGARIGFNKNGAYVAGGRHGLYYREKIGPKSKRTRSGSRSASSGGQPTVEEFVNTGLTYSGSGQAGDTTTPPRAPVFKQRDPLVTAGFAGGWIVLIAGILTPSLLTVVVGCLILLIARVAKTSRKKQAQLTLMQAAESLENITDSDRPDQLLQALAAPSLPEPERTQRNLLLADAAVSLFMDGSTSFNRFDMESYLRGLELDEDHLNRIKSEALDELISDCLADHQLTDEEEKHLFRMIEDLGIPTADQSRQKKQIRDFTHARDAVQNLKEISCPLSLTRGEMCYFSTKGRLLKRKQLGRYQREGVVYKQMGYETDLEGTVYVTNKNIHLAGDTTRSIRLSQITSITEDLVENVITLSLNNRVNPVYLTTPDTLPLSFLLDHLTRTEA